MSLQENELEDPSLENSTPDDNGDENQVIPMPLLDSFDLSFIEDPTFEPRELRPSIRKTHQKLLRKPPLKKSRRKKKVKRFSLMPKERRHVIQHNYHDRSSEMPEANDFTRIIGQTSLSSPTGLKKKGGVAIPFPLKLHELLDKAEEEKLTHIVSWQPHGRAFVVHQPKKFVSELMHRFFRQTKLTSFQRQLNLYGFSRLTRGPDGGGYYHELFLRGRPYLTQKMVRTKIKGTGFKAASNPACEPDFYAMPVVNAPVVGLGSSYSYDNLNSLDVEDIPQVVTPTPSCDAAIHRSIVEKISPATIRNISLPKIENTETWGENKSEECSQIINLSNCSGPRVKMGNQSFQYIGSYQPPCESEVSFRPIDKSKRRLSGSTKGAFDMLGDTALILDEDIECDDPSQDPLSLFLEDIGSDFEDDINFGSDEAIEFGRALDKAFAEI